MTPAAVLPEAAALHAAVNATWPAAEERQVGPFTLRAGRGGGSRVSAATVTGAFSPADLEQAEAAMRGMGQDCLFMIREEDGALDAALAARGYAVKDPVVGYVAPVAVIAVNRPPPVTTFEVWPPLAVQADIWAEGGIGPARIAVMERAPGPKVTILGRHADSPAGAAFVGCDGGMAMVHALEVRPRFRRQGLARQMLIAAAFWVQAQGAAHLGLVVTRGNVAANALYLSMGMTMRGAYHYRIGPG